MKPDHEPTPRQWYEAAAHWHVQEHQGCPCCGGQHCVFRSEWGCRIEYYCTACDFSASHDADTGRYFATAAARREQPSTILDPTALHLGDVAGGV
jgi:hypothetical protein